MGKKRIDVLLVERGLAETRQRAQALLLAGDVRVAGRVIAKSGSLVDESSQISVRAPLKYVSRGGFKLEGALARFNIDVTGLMCADLGASTGGFTDCLLQHGAARVYAIDVGYGQLAWKLRIDPRVVVMDRVNIRFLESLPNPVDLVTIDTSFISLALILPAAKRIIKPNGKVVALVKPQFEAGREQVGKGGIVRNQSVHRQVLENIGRYAASQEWGIQGLMPSPILGAEGNAEFFIYLAQSASSRIDYDEAINQVIGEE